MTYYGAVAQLARASHWQCEGREFESLLLHHDISATRLSGFFVAFFRGDFQLKTHFLSPSRPARKELKPLKSPFSITFTDLEGDESALSNPPQTKS